MSMRVNIENHEVAEAIADGDLQIGEIILELANNCADIEEFAEEMQASCDAALASPSPRDSDAALEFLKAIENLAIDRMAVKGETP